MWGFLVQEVTQDNQERRGRTALLETLEILGREEIWVPLEIRVTKVEVGSAILDQEDQRETWGRKDGQGQLGIEETVVPRDCLGAKELQGKWVSQGYQGSQGREDL